MKDPKKAQDADSKTMNALLRSSQKVTQLVPLDPTNKQMSDWMRQETHRGEVKVDLDTGEQVAWDGQAKPSDHDTKKPGYITAHAGEGAGTDIPVHEDDNVVINRFIRNRGRKGGYPWP